jgi:hypothetical protein
MTMSPKYRIGGNIAETAKRTQIGGKIIIFPDRNARPAITAIRGSHKKISRKKNALSPDIGFVGYTSPGMTRYQVAAYIKARQFKLLSVLDNPIYPTERKSHGIGIVDGSLIPNFYTLSITFPCYDESTPVPKIPGIPRMIKMRMGNEHMADSQIRKAPINKIPFNNFQIFFVQSRINKDESLPFGQNNTIHIGMHGISVTGKQIDILK